MKGFSRSHGFPERNVQGAKLLLRKCLHKRSAIWLSLLHQRNIDRNLMGSPAQRLVWRRTKTL